MRVDNLVEVQTEPTPGPAAKDKPRHPTKADRSPGWLILDLHLTGSARAFMRKPLVGFTKIARKL